MSREQDKETNTAIVIGGGIAGLACAVGLTDAGIPVHLIERDSEAGGRACSTRDEQTGDVVDIGPHVFTTEHRNMLALLERLGTQDRIYWQPEQFITLVDNGNAIPMFNYRLPAPLHFLPNFLRVKRLSLADVWSARRVLWRVMQLTEDDVLRYDRRNGLDVLREFGVSSQFIDWFWRTVCMAILNVPLEQCSAGSLLRFLRMMSGRGDFFFGFAHCGLAELFVPGALERIRGAGGRVECATSVREILVEDNRFRGVVLEDGRRIDSDHCVSALPPAELHRLLPPALREDHRVFADLPTFESSPYVSTYLWFTRKLTDERFWARRWSAENINYDFYDLSNIRPSWRGRPSVIATNIIFSERVAGWDDEDIIDATLDELGEFLPEADRKILRHARVHRIPMAIPAPRPGFEALRPATRSPVNGLYLAGDWTATALPASMESAARSGWLAAEAVAGDRGCPVSLSRSLRPMHGLAGALRRSLDEDQ